MSTSAPSEIAVTPVGHTSALAWVTPVTGGAELTIVGKLVVALGLEGQVEMVPSPELPGWHQARPAPAEVDKDAARRIVARGRRMHAGKVVLRRGSNVLVECAFGPGEDPVGTPLANNMQTTIAGKRGDEWLVVEGGDRPDARRWCKLPKLGLVATWNDVERMVLTSRVCFVDVSDWTISFLMRGSRKILPTMAPRHLSVAVHDLTSGASPLPVRAPAVTGPPAPAPTPAPGPPPSPFAPKKGAFMSDDTTTGIRLNEEDFFVTEAPTAPMQKKAVAARIAAQEAAPSPEPPPEPEAQPATRIFSYEEAMKTAGLKPGLKEEQTVFASDPRALVPKVFNEPTPPPQQFRGPEPRKSNGSGLRLGRGSGVMNAVTPPAPTLDEAFDMLEGKIEPKK